MSHRTRRLPLLFFAAAAVGLAGPGAAAEAAKVPPPGKLISKERVRGGSLPLLGTHYRVLYSSRSVKGKNVAVSGVITLPSGKPPKGGFPVVSWAHGTTGIADACAPSRSVTEPPDNDYVRSFAAQAAYWVKQGYAVAQTDYQGLGTAGMHPYLIGAAEGRSVIDIVGAARGLSPKVGKRWVAIGHSQGGHAVLWAGALARTAAPSLKLRGVVAVAPASHIGEQAAVIDSIDGNPFGGLPAIIVAAALDHAGIAPESAFSDKAMALYPQIEQVCLDVLSSPDSFGGLSLSEHFREGFDRQPVIDLIAENDPEDLTLKVPVLVTQGTADTTVFPTFTEQLVDAYEARGTAVTYKTYEGSTHTGILQDARADEDAFVVKLLG